MSLRATFSQATPAQIKQIIPPNVKAFLNPPTKSRRLSNRWLAQQAAKVSGKVLSIGSGSDKDGEGKLYREYFVNATSYTTSEVSPDFNTDLVLDVRSMPQISDQSYDCVLCNGVLEHVDDDLAALREMQRILRPAGVLLMGLPFRQAIHLAPTDFRRYTEYGIRYLLAKNFEIIALDAIDTSVKGFPTAYWVKARKLA